VSDITYIRSRQGWLYLTTVIDLGDRKIIGWALSLTMKAIDTVIPAFKMAKSRRPITQKLIFIQTAEFNTPATSFENYWKGAN